MNTIFRPRYVDVKLLRVPPTSVLGEDQVNVVLSEDLDNSDIAFIIYESYPVGSDVYMNVASDSLQDLFRTIAARGDILILYIYIDPSIDRNEAIDSLKLYLAKICVFTGRRGVRIHQTVVKDDSITWCHEDYKDKLLSLVFSSKSKDSRSLKNVTHIIPR